VETPDLEHGHSRGECRRYTEGIGPKNKQTKKKIAIYSH
jgi:hypothetical protein